MNPFFVKGVECGIMPNVTTCQQAIWKLCITWPKITYVPLVRTLVVFSTLGNALLRLETATRVGMLESAVQLETILLRNTPAIQARTNELLFGTKTVDVVAHDILNKTGEFVHLFIYLIF